MKVKRLKRFGTLSFVLTMAGVGLAHAQSYEVEQAKIPFDFYAGAEKMPAGTYDFSIDLEGDIVKLSNSAGQHQVLLMGAPDDDQDTHYALVFDHSGDSYFLKELESDEVDMRFSTESAEREKANDKGSAEVQVKMNHS
ncbi:MAG TPA: hypothetical protein VHZ55_26255 [Bryobacteraceae bacterium]|nr:hypothetical protein [Bryobacteraceae bacterium]